MVKINKNYLIVILLLVFSGCSDYIGKNFYDLPVAHYYFMGPTRPIIFSEKVPEWLDKNMKMGDAIDKCDFIDSTDWKKIEDNDFVTTKVLTLWLDPDKYPIIKPEIDKGTFKKVGIAMIVQHSKTAIGLSITIQSVAMRMDDKVANTPLSKEKVLQAIVTNDTKMSLM